VGALWAGLLEAYLDRDGTSHPAFFRPPSVRVPTLSDLTGALLVL
jgi:hypothetical protein